MMGWFNDSSNINNMELDKRIFNVLSGMELASCKLSVTYIMTWIITFVNIINHKKTSNE